MSMRSLTTFLGCLGLIVTTASADAMEQMSPSTQLGGPSWSAYIGGVALNRSKPKGVDRFDFGWNAGLELDVRGDVWPDYQLQLRYLGVDKWTESADTPQFGGVDANANLHSLEVNLYRQQTERVKLLGGFRWIKTRENAADSLTNTINSRNQMLGAQVGVEFLAWDNGGPLTVSTALKAGAFHNRARREANFGPLPQSRRSNTAIAGEWDITARIEVADQFHIRAGYQLLWLNRIASFDAAQVQGVNNGDPVSTRSRRFHHGATVGVEWSF
jgi:hypothetical protein